MTVKETPLSAAAEHRKITSASKAALVLIDQANGIALKKIEDREAISIKKIEDREASSIKVVADAAAEALKVTGANSPNNLLDHDAITRLTEAVSNLDEKFTEKFKEVGIGIKEIKDGILGRVEKLEIYVYEKLEPRVHKLENQVARFWITIGLYTLAVGSMIYLLLNHISK